MSMSDTDKWASQLIEDLLEELAAIENKTGISKWQNLPADHDTRHLELQNEFVKEHKMSKKSFPIESEEEQFVLHNLKDASKDNDVIQETENLTDPKECCVDDTSVAESSVLNAIEKDNKIPDDDNTEKDLYIANNKIPIGFNVNLKSVGTPTTIPELEKINTEDTFFHDRESGLENGENQMMICNTAEASHHTKSLDTVHAYYTGSGNDEFDSKEADLYMSAKDLEDLKRIDGKVHNIGFLKQHETYENGKDSSRVDLYYKYFNRRYIREEMEYRMQEEGRSSETKFSSNIQANEICQEPALEKRKEFEDNKLKYMLHVDTRARKKENEEYGIQNEAIYDDDNYPIVLERTEAMIQLYRNICKVFEDLIFRPIAILVAESIDVLMFIFFLSVSMLYMLYRRMVVRESRRLLWKCRRCSFQQGNQTMKDSLKDDAHSMGDSTNETGKIGEKDLFICSPSNLDLRGSCMDSSSNEDILSEANQINVNPENVCIHNSPPDQVKQNLKDVYEKGSNFLEYLNEKNCVASIRSYNDSIVDIVLKESDKIIEENYVGSDLDMEIKTPNANNCQKCSSDENTDLSPTNKYIFSNRIEKNILCSPAKSDSVESILNDFLKDTGKDNRCILNSTEIDQSGIERRSSSTHFRVLSPSERDILREMSAICSPSETVDDVLNSSMSVNLSSLSYMEQINSRSLPSLNVREKGSGENSIIRSNSNRKGKPELNDKDEEMHLKTKQVSEYIKCVRSRDSQPTPIEIIEKNEKTKSKEKCCEEISENINNNFQTKPKIRESASEIPNLCPGNLHVCTELCKNSFINSSEERLSDSSTPNTISNTDLDPLLEDTIFDENSSKTKNGVKFRRRMSSILHNWRSMSMCMVPNPKFRKKHKKEN